MNFKNFIFWAFIFSFNSLFSARPTVNSSNLNFSNKTCVSVTLSWTKGNGNSRIVVAKEGSTVNFLPSDNTSYSFSNKFASSLQQGSGNYVVYNDTGNSVNITNLISGKTYYFAIYEHDDNGSNILYLTNGAAISSIVTYSISLGFDVLYLDSCQQTNKYTFTNTSTSTIPGVTYTFDYGFGNTSTQSVDTHSFTNAGLVPVRIIANPSLGCPNQLTKNVRVYNKRVAFIDFNIYDDTVQCFEGNYFEIDPTPVVSPLLAPYKYNWSFGDNTTSSFKRMKKSYKSSGRYNVELEIVTTVNNQATACKDTIMFDVVVLPSPNLQFLSDTFNKCEGDIIQFNFNKVSGFEINYNNKIYNNFLDSVLIDTLKLGTYFLKVNLNNPNFCQVNDSINFDVYPYAPKPSFNTFRNTFTANRDSFIQWYFNGEAIKGANKKIFLPSLEGKYQLGYKPPFHCLTLSDHYEYKNVSVNHFEFLNSIKIFPNPTQFFLKIENFSENELEIEIFDFTGKLLKTISLQSGENSIDVSELSTGLYFIKFKTNEYYRNLSFIKE